MIAQPQILNNFKFFAGADVARSAGATVGTLVNPSILANGEIVITDAGNVILDVATVLTAPAIKIVMGRGSDNTLWESQLFNYNDIKSYTGVEYAAKVQQVSYYGFNAVTNSGSFDVINDNYYSLVISFYELVSQEASALFNPIIVDYLSTASATQEEIVNGLYRQLIRQLFYWSKKPVVAERVSSALNGGAATVAAFAVTSPVNSIVSAALAAAVSVGDYVRFNLTAVAENDIYAVYKVVAVDLATNTVTFDTAIQVTGTFDLYVLTAAAVQAGNMGIRITGLNQQFILDSRPYGLVTFQIGLSGGGSTNLSYQIGAYIGHGTYEQMRTQEAASWRNQGVIYNYTEFPPVSVFTDLIASQNHSTLDIVLEKPVKALNISEFRAQLTLACALDGNVANTFKSSYIGATGCVSVLDSYITNFTNLSAQAGNL
jgi:hypothetical protein